MTIPIKMVRADRDDLEKQIAALIREFESMTGCICESMDWRRSEALGKQSELVSVEIGVDLGRWATVDKDDEPD